MVQFVNTFNLTFRNELELSTECEEMALSIVGLYAVLQASASVIAQRASLHHYMTPLCTV